MPASQENGTVTIVNSRKFDINCVEKLTKDNYRTWYMRMKAVFITHGILDIVDGSRTRPEADGPERKAYDQGSNEAYTALLLTMANEQVDKVSGCDTPMEIWTKLKVIYQNTTAED